MRKAILGLGGLTAAALTFGLLASSGSAGATTAPPPGVPTTVTAVTKLTHRPDGGGGGNNWAYDNGTRTLTEQVLGSAPASACGLPDGSACYAITARVTDRGSFTPFIGSLAPNQGDVHAGQTITGTTTGQWGGSGQWAEFFSPVLPNASLVPATESGKIHASYQWPDLMFPAGTQLTGADNEVTYNYVYTEFGGTTHQQQWIDANFDNDGQSQAGQADFQGQITG